MLVTTASNLTISNNTITGAGTDIGIAVSAGSTNITIENNVIERTAPGSPDSVGIGVQVDATSTGAAALECNTFSGWLDNLDNVNQAPCITTTSPLLGGTVGTPYSSTLTGHTPNPPLTWTATGLPPGLTLAPDGTITGTPTTRGRSPSPPPRPTTSPPPQLKTSPSPLPWRRSRLRVPAPRPARLTR